MVRSLTKINAFLENELIINLLIKKYNVTFIDSNVSDIKPLYYRRVNEYFKNGFFIFEDHLGDKNYAINNLLIIANINTYLLEEYRIYLIRRKDFKHILQREFAKKNSKWVVNQLEDISNHLSAKNINYVRRVTEFLIVFYLLLIYYPNLFILLNNSVYITQNILKLILLKYGATKVQDADIITVDDNMPIYSILIPLYDEASKASFIINSINKLNYPKYRLDVKLIVEEDDILTLKAIRILELPSYIEIITVPYSLPRTKPKALNYAMSYVTGDFVSVYDAEDRPDPDQLLKALHAFRTMPKHYVCIQAKLNFYNAKENILTRFFSIEYTLWFEYLLRGLSILDLPLTLGGTSNHFKVDSKRQFPCI